MQSVGCLVLHANDATLFRCLVTDFGLFEAGGKLQRAQQVAGAARAACDLLKGAPKSSRNDPDFMNNYYKSSRLHFIGTWKARIEALVAKTAGAD